MPAARFFGASVDIEIQWRCEIWTCPDFEWSKRVVFIVVMGSSPDSHQKWTRTRAVCRTWNQVYES